MSKTLRLAKMLLFFLGVASAALAQNPAGTIVMSGSKIVNLSGIPEAQGTLCVQLSAAGQNISAKLGGGGQITQPPSCVPIVNGAFSINVPDTSLTFPQNVCLALTATDYLSGDIILQNGYSCVQPTSAPGSTWCSTTSGTTTCNFDLYPTNLPSLALVQAGPPGLSAYQLYQQSGGTLSQNAWLTSLQGTPGTPGTNGVASLPSLAAIRTRLPATANLLNPATNVSGTISAADGSFASNGYLSTDYIPANSGGVMATGIAIISGNSGYAFYDANYAFISGSGAGLAAGGHITVPANAAFIRFTYANPADAANCPMFVNGLTLPAGCVPFTAIVVSPPAYAATALQLAMALQSKSVQLLDPSRVSLNTALLVTGATDTNVGTTYQLYVTDYMPVIAGGQYTIVKANGGGNPADGLVWYDINRNVIGNVPQPLGGTVTAPAGALWARFQGSMQYLNAAMFLAGSTTSSSYIPFGTNVPAPTTASLGAWAGKTLCALSDSIFAVGGIPQLEAPKLGMTLGYYDLLPGRTVAGTFNGFTGSGASSTFTGNDVSQGASTNIPTGLTLAAFAAACDVVQIETFGNNTDSGVPTTQYPYGPTWGLYTDTSSASTVVGQTRAVWEALKLIKPTLRIIGVSPYMYPTASGYFPNLSPAVYGQLLSQVLGDYGEPNISMVPSGMSPPRGNSPGNFVDASGNSLYGLANNNVHPSALGASTLLVPYLVRAMNLYGPQ